MAKTVVTGPDYVPAPINVFITNKYPGGGLKAFANDIQVPYNTVVNLFKRSDHYSLTVFIELARKLDMPPDDLAEIFDVIPAERKGWLEKKKDVVAKDLKDLIVYGEPDDYFYSVLKGFTGTIVKKYIAISRKSKIDLPVLHQLLLAQAMRSDNDRHH